MNTNQIGMRIAAPHMFIIDTKGKIVYRGAIDNTPLGKNQKRKRMSIMSKKPSMNY